MHTSLLKLYFELSHREVKKYKLMYQKCCEKLNKQKKIIKSLEYKIIDLLDQLEKYK